MWSSGILPIMFLFAPEAGLLSPPSRNFKRAARPGDKRLRTDGREEGGGSRLSSLLLSGGIVVVVLVVVVVVIGLVLLVEVAVAVDDVDVVDLNSGWDSRERNERNERAVVVLSVEVVELFFEFEEGHETNCVKEEARRNPLLEFWDDAGGALDGAEGYIAGMDTISCSFSLENCC